MARPTKHEARYKWVGRKTKITPEVITKLEQAASYRCGVKEMCFYAGISHTTYYNFCEKNPEFLERIDSLRQSPIILARQNIISKVPVDVNVAFRFLEKETDGYAEKLKVEHSGSVTTDVVNHMEDEELRTEFKERLRGNIQKRWQEKNGKPNDIK